MVDTLYKIGPVLAVNHGMGMGSASIMLNKMLKLIQYCKLENVKIIRMGSSGGVAVDPGTLIITKSALSPLLEPFYTLAECGKERKLRAEPDPKLNQDLIAAAQSLGKFNQ